MKVWLLNTFRQAAWAPSLVLLFYFIVGKGFSAYSAYPDLDMPTHFFGGMALAYFYLVAIFQSQQLIGPCPQLLQSICALGLAAISNILWEFMETLWDLGFATHINQGINDTLSDLFFGLFGATMMVLLAKPPERF
ncbi:MAG: hypothetical protein HYZ45_06600 [Burkholderiales bacterium]|nr:hypothetical protein [Burkholderiales bacterium]